MRGSVPRADRRAPRRGALLDDKTPIHEDDRRGDLAREALTPSEFICKARRASQNASPSTCSTICQDYILAFVGDGPNDARLGYSVKLRRHRKVSEDLAIVHHVHGAAVVAEHHLVRPLETAPIFRLWISVRSRLNVLRKGRPFDAGRLKELNPQHDRPSWDQALRAGVEYSEHGSEQIVVRPEILGAPGYSVDWVVCVPFEDWVDVAVRVRVGGDQWDTACAFDVDLEPVRWQLRHEGLVADVELRQR